MCSYNGEKFIGDQLKSMIDQIRPPDEIIICDDGSTDNTIGIIRSIVNSTTVPVSVIQNKNNLGVTKNFEQAVSITTGDIIFLSDQDDVWFKDKINTMIEPFVNDKDVIMSYHDAHIVDKDLKSKGFSIFDDRSYLKLGQQRKIENIIEDVGTKGSTMAFRSTIKNEILPFGDLILWSHDYWISTIAHSIGKVIPINKPLMYYRIHENNVSGNIKNPNFNIKTLDLLRTIKKGHSLSYFLTKRKILGERLAYINLNNFNSSKLDKFIEVNKKYIEFYDARVQIQSMGTLSRLVSSTKLLKTGIYHQYFNGYFSFIRDSLKF